MNAVTRRNTKSTNAVGLLCIALAFSCRGAPQARVPGKYVGVLSGDSVGTTRSILELEESGRARWALGTQNASYAVQADTVFVDLASGVPTVIPLVIRGDSLIWRDKERTYGVWLRAAR